jgi:hypothetical protein
MMVLPDCIFSASRSVLIMEIRLEMLCRALLKISRPRAVRAPNTSLSIKSAVASKEASGVRNS